MSDFLNFLNTADLDTLTRVPGVTRPLAGNIIAARPFDFVEDCLHVKGMGKNLLGRAQSYFESELNESSDRALVPVEAHAAPEPADPAGSFWSRMERAFANVVRSFLRLLITVAVIAIFGAVIYYGLPYLNEKFMAPVEANTVQVKRLESQIAGMRSQLDKLKSRVDVLDRSVESQTASLDRLKIMQNTLEETLQENHDQALLDLKHEMMTTRALDMLGRARLYLAQSNFGSARADVQSARDLLAELQAEVPDADREQAIGRLDLTLENLPEFPVVAAGDLEIAWQWVITGESPPPVTPAAKQILTPTASVTLTVTP